jgi:TonB family protein
MRATIIRIANSVAIAAALFASSAEAQLQPQAPVQATPSPQVWEADWVSPHCTISTGNANEVALALWMTPGDPDPELYVVGSPGSLPNGNAQITLTLLPSGRTFQPQVGSGLGGTERRVLKLTRLRDAFPGAFAGSTEIRLAAGSKTLTVPITGADKAVAAVRQCIDSKLPEWGIDAKAFDALQTPPTDIEGTSWLGPDDYPSQALNNNEMGTVVARMSVDASGRVTACNVVVPSGSPSLDAVTCELALRRARFHPAIAADGAPTAAQRIVSTVFRLSQ